MKEEKKDKNNVDVQQTGGLRERLGRVKPTRWARFAIVAAIFIGWVVWLGSW